MLGRAADGGHLPSVILWGPPGCGKTTLARILAKKTDAEFVQVSAVASGVADLRKVIADASNKRSVGIRTLLFIDEIHRFNKAQQDTVLPYVEDGTITLIGATTENPSFEVIAPLLSRARVVRLKSLDAADLARLLERALADSATGLGGMGLTIDDDAKDFLASGANGDARAALTALEIAASTAAQSGETEISVLHVRDALANRRPYHDRKGDYHYDTVSALIKTLRGSDPDGAVYWLARMIESGEDPLFIIRRLVVFAAEDIGLADPNALSVTVACQQAVHFIGMPEGSLPLSECVLYLALAPKSNSAYMSYNRAREAAENTAHLPVPMHLRNAPTQLMREMGHGDGYRYAHDEEGHFARGVSYLPEELGRAQYYIPGDLGVEAGLNAAYQRLRGTQEEQTEHHRD